MALTWLITLGVWYLAGGQIPTMAWLLLVPFVIQDAHDSGIRSR